MTGPFVIGIAPGRADDRSALAILGVAAGPPRRYDVRHLHRWPLGAAYPQIVADVEALAARPELRPHVAAPPGPGSPRARVEVAPAPPVILDVTEVGRAIVELFAGARLGGPVVPVTVVTGGRARWDPPAGSHGPAATVPRRDLVAVVQALLQGGRLKVVPGLAEAEVLRRELLGFRAGAHAAPAEARAGREGPHDDLLLAVAVAAWAAEDPPPVHALRVGANILRGFRG